ncbi:hypothetical protein LX69_00153 [Breznakibacter xylanolyticus]|uniref:Uncharacterized protein n=1 Tax=Breznakibacter xylanolyticus TaxID=990 RepID=A0A2W7NKC6_9BACT|nr:hypothetical protein [Breznakibacter xylanolyticus]PZX20728.1 hypothetical protein LX69_00153 [Breznakibacter xylanolyticus]
MKQLLTILILTTAIQFITAQPQETYISTNASINIISPSMAEARIQLNQFLTSNNINLEFQKEYTGQTNYHFPLSENQWKQLEQMLPQLGHVASLELTKENQQDAVDRIHLELNYLNEKKDSYAALLKEIDNKSDQYMELWREMKNIEEKIFNLKRNLITYQNTDNLYNVKIFVTDETTTPDKTRVSFINMPGAEYSYLTINTPTQGLSAAHYDGYFLKYMFTRGKSFITLGAYNSTAPQQNDSTLTELFVFGFGQDFYSRYLGRGHRRFFNLYSGYTIGYMLGTGEVTTEDIFFVTPSVGLELFKNRYLLIDTKAGYFIPFNYNKQMRGWNINASLNFVF